MVRCGCDSGTRVKSWVFASTRANGDSRRFRIDKTELSANSGNVASGMEMAERGRRVPLDCAPVRQLSTVKWRMADSIQPSERCHVRMETPCSLIRLPMGPMRDGILIAMARPCRRHVAGSRRYMAWLFPGRDAMVGGSLGKKSSIVSKKKKRLLLPVPSNPRCGPSAQRTLDLVLTRLSSLISKGVCPIRSTNRWHCGPPRRSAWATNRGRQLDDGEAPGTWHALALALTGRAGRPWAVVDGSVPWLSGGSGGPISCHHPPRRHRLAAIRKPPTTTLLSTPRATSPTTMLD